MKKLEPTVGLWSVVAIAVSAMLSGLFVLPGLAAEKTGASIWLAFLLAGLGVLPAALSKSELATAMPSSGGTYVYLARAFGPLVGTISGLGLWLSLLLKSAFSLVGFGVYLRVLADVPLVPMALGLLVLITLLNILGIGKVSKAQIAVVGAGVGGLIALLALGFDTMDPGRLQPMFSEGAGGFIEAAAFVFVSYSGVTKMAALAEEVKNPERTIPRSMLLSLFLATLFSVVTCFAMVTVIPMASLTGDLKPIHTLALHVGGETVAAVAAVLAIITMTAMATAGILASSRFPFAMARDSLLPGWLAHVDARFKTPVACILLTSICMAVAIIFLDVGPIAKLASGFKVVVFIAVNMAVLVMRESRVAWYKPTYHSPLYPWVQIFGIVLELVFLIALGVAPMVACLVTAAVGGVVYLIFGRRRSTHTGVMGKLGRRRELLAEVRSNTTQENRVISGSPAAVLVALDGSERSPETLVEVGAALSGDRHIRVLHLTEVPEQLLELDAVPEPVAVDSLRRRIEAMGDVTGHEVGFESFATHDTVATIHRAANEGAPEWALVEWAGISKHGRYIRDPRAWLHRHMPCNLALFHDAGVRYIRKILVYPQPGPDDALVVVTADHLAEVYDASLTYVRFVAADADATALQSQADYLDQVGKLSTRTPETMILRGKDFVSQMAEATAGYDLLVMGAPLERGLFALLGTRKDRLTEASVCSVLRLQTPHERFHAPVAKRSAGEEAFELLSHVKPSCLGAELSLGSKTAVFHHVSEAFAQVAPESSAAEIEAALWARERTQNTSVGMGVALPHATIPSMERTVMGIFVSAQPVSYQALDEQPVDVFVVTLGPARERQSHLLLLASVSKLILRTQLLPRLREAEDGAGVHDALRESLAEIQES